MSITTSCPKCQANFVLPEELAGRQVKCQRCGEVFRAPAGDPEIVDARLADEPAAPQPQQRSPRNDAGLPPPMPAPRPYDSAPDVELPRRRRERDDRPPPRRLRGSQRGTDPWVIIGIVGGVLLLVGGVATAVMLIDAPRPRQVAFKPMVKAPPFPPKMEFKDKVDFNNPPIMFPQNAPGNLPIAPLDNAKAIQIPLKMGAFQGVYKLTAADPFDPDRRYPCKHFLVTLEAGKTYVIDHEATQGNFDPYLRLENPAGKQVAFNDDAGGTLDSQIRYTPAEAGSFRIIATSLGGGFGDFTLEVRALP